MWIVKGKFFEREEEFLREGISWKDREKSAKKERRKKL